MRKGFTDFVFCVRIERSSTDDRALRGEESPGSPGQSAG